MNRLGDQLPADPHGNKKARDSPPAHGCNVCLRFVAHHAMPTRRSTSGNRSTVRVRGLSPSTAKGEAMPSDTTGKILDVNYEQMLNNKMN